MTPRTFFATLWEDYIRLAPMAAKVHALFAADNEPVQNDHVAFRTFEHDGIRLGQLEPLLLGMGYRRFAPYDFPDKHLKAWGYVPPEPTLPRVFLSALNIQALSATSQGILNRLLRQMRLLSHPEPSIFWAGRLWPMPSWRDYQTLAKESEYAAWLASIGLHANHFTVAVHALPQPNTLEDVVSRVQGAGFTMNQDGGLIKGKPEDLLEQAATLADHKPYVFADGDAHDIPTCYYEFARRYPDARGQLYDGFVAANAARIFTSTDQRTPAGGTP